MKKNVSIIIPTYNRMKSLEQSINSILKQTYPYFEILVVDDASTDRTEELVKSFSDERIRYIKCEKNMGPAAARNIGLEEARYEYIAFNDSDDIWLDEKLEKQMDKMQSHAELGMVYCAYYLVSENKKMKIPSDRFSPIDLEGDIFQSLWQENKIGTPTMLLKKECVEKIGGFNEGLHSLEDWEFVLRFALHYQIGYINEILVNAAWSDKGVNSNVAAQVGTYYFLMEHYGKKGLDISSKISAMMNAMSSLSDATVAEWKAQMIPKYFEGVKEFEQSLKNSKEHQKCVMINNLLEEISDTSKLKTFLKNHIDFKTDTVAIYGAGTVGEILTKELSEIGSNIYCIFDRNEILLKGFKVQKPCYCNDMVTKLIVTIGENIDDSEFQSWAGDEVEVINIYDMLAR